MIISIYLFNMQKQYNGSNPEILWFPRDIIVFRLFAYLLYIICLNQLLLYKTSYIYIVFVYFDPVLYQFLETGTSDRCLICIVQCLRFSGFILYSFHFSFTVPLKKNLKTCRNAITHLTRSRSNNVQERI